VRRCARLVAAAVVLLLASPCAWAASLSARLPPDAWLVAEVDVASLRGGGWLGETSTSVDPLLVALRDAGFIPARDVSRLALAIVSGTQQDTQAVVLARGRFDRKAIEAALVKAGGERVDLAGAPAVRMPQREVRLDDSTRSLVLDEPLLVSFLDDAIVLGTRRASRAVHESKAPPGLLLSPTRKEVPTSAAHWLVADLARQFHPRDATSAAVTSELKTLAAWGSGTDVVELRAIAHATDEKAAAQVALFAPIALGFLGGDPAGVHLEGVKVEAAVEKVMARASLVKRASPLRP
jgi:hypothetical protein